MKTSILILAFIFSADLYAQVGIGTTSPASSAKLDVASTTSGFLPPRMTMAQRNSIPNPAAGLVVWCIDCDELQVYNGTVWKNLMGEAASVISPPFVTICGEDWMVRNVDVSTYKNGDPIPKVTDPATWLSLTMGAYCYYNNDSTTYAATYGKLYNWYAVNDPGGLCPEGWHVATDAEYSMLSTCLGGDAVAGGKMKETGTSHWNSPNTGATNSSGFTGLPGGYRNPSGSFVAIGTLGIWWSSTEDVPDNGWNRYVSYSLANLYRNTNDKNFGSSVRCVRD